MKDVHPRTGTLRVVHPYARQSLSLPLPTRLHARTSASTSSIDSEPMCTRARSGRRSSNGVGGGPDQINTKTRTGAGYSRRHGDEDVVIKLTPPGNPPLHGTRLRPGPSQPCLSPSPSASGQVYITPTPQDLIRWKHHQFHLQPPLATSSLLLPSAMNYHHPSMSSTVYECRYCAPGLTSFTDWRPLVMHEACDHIDMLNRIPCPADGCDKNYAQLKYLITHYNIHSGRLTHCPKCNRGYTDPSRASRCRQSHDRHFKCPVTKCDYSNARADLVKQHCRKKHPDIGDISTAQLESEPSPPPPSSSDPFPSPSSSSSSFVFSANPAPPPQVDPEHGLPTSAPPYPRYALAQAAENRRKQMIVELRAAHVALSRLSEDAFDAEVPEYPIKRNGGMVGDEVVGGYVQGPNEDGLGGAELEETNAGAPGSHHHHQYQQHAQQHHYQHQHQGTHGTMSAPTTPTRGSNSPIGGAYHPHQHQHHSMHVQQCTNPPTSMPDLTHPSWSSTGGLIPTHPHHPQPQAQYTTPPLTPNYHLSPHPCTPPNTTPTRQATVYHHHPQRPVLHPSGYPGPAHSSPGPSPGRSSSIGSYYSTTPPAGQWTASDLMQGGYAQPTATTPPAMEYVGQQQAWPSAVGRGVGPQQQQQSGYSSLSGFQGQQVHRHRRDYST